MDSKLYSTLIKEVGEEGMGMPIQLEIFDLFKAYMCQMMDEFLNVLPPEQTIYHHIDLESGL